MQKRQQQRAEPVPAWNGAVHLAGRRDITLDAFRRVAWEGAAVTIDAAAVARMARCRDAFLALIDGDPDVVVYGVTSGYGFEAKRRFTPEQRQAHAKRPSHATATAFGSALPERLARGIVLARLANFLDGYSAVSPSVALEVAAMLGREMPTVARLGHGGAGEIQVLGLLFAELMGRIEAGEKDMLCLVNGSPAAAATVADGALAAERRLETATRVLALAYDAFKAPLEHLDPALDRLWGDADEAAVLTAMRALLDGAGKTGRRAYQAPVSFRIGPRLLGRLRRALGAARETAATSLSAVTDNPVFLPPEEAPPRGRVMSTGGYHNAAAAPALDGLAAACADLCLIAERQAAKMLDGAISDLPDQLRTSPDDPRFLGCAGMAAVGWGERARLFAQTTLIPGPESGGYGQNDVATNALIAWDKVDEAGRCLDAALAILAVVASQALHVTGRPAPPPLEPYLEELRDVVPPFETMRVPGPEFERLAETFTARALAA